MTDKTDQEFIEGREQQLPPDPRRHAGDVMSDASNAQALRSAPMGDPPADFDVRSIFDSRPINGYDFNLSASADFAFNEVSIARVSFAVREGFIMIPRVLHHVSLPVAGRANTLLSVQVDGADVPDNTAIPVGPASDDLVKLFLVLDEFSVLTFICFAASNTAGSLLIHLYGNYIRKTDRAPPYEVANPIGRFGKRGQNGPTSIENAFRQDALRSPISMPATPVQIERSSQAPAAPISEPIMTAERWARMSMAEKLRYGKQFGVGVK